MAAAVTSAEQAIVQLQRARALLDMARHEDAIPLLKDSVRLNPESAETYCSLGLALQLAGDLEQSLSVLNEAVRQAPNSEWPHRLLSITYKALGDHEASVRSAREAHRLAPDIWQTAYTLSDALLGSQQLAEAQGVAERLRQLAPDNALTFSLLGRIALARKQLLEAEMHFREALRLDPQSVAAHNNLGSTLLDQGRVKEAIGHFDSALTLNPTLKVAQTNLYLGARTLRHQTWLATSKSLLLRISPKGYQYYLHREESSFKIFFFVFLWKLVVPLTACFALLALSIRALTGEVDMPGIVLSELCLAGFLLAIARLGWAKRYFEASASQVQIITTLSAWLFSSLTLAALGVLGLVLDPPHWVLYLFLTITGATLFGRQALGKVRALYYGVAARFYPSAQRLRARYDHYLASTRAGRCIGMVLEALRNPVFYLVIGVIGLRISHGEGYGALWIPVVYAGVMFTVSKGLRHVRGRSKR